jgi:hypothetical protein
MTDPLLGTVVDGRYRVDRLIGSGGFGTVYAAWHLRLEQQVALKLMKVTADGEGLRDEARILTSLRHPHIVSAIDLGTTRCGEVDTPYLAMEWCDGESLERVLGERALPLAEALAIFGPIVDAVASAHERGIAHRDIKPANVVLAAGGPRLLDFGIAKLFEPGDAAGTGRTRSESGTSAFTRAYAAPEQIAGARTGPWTDVHALGLLFVALVTGRRPYGDDDGAGIRAVDPRRPTPRALGVDVGALEAVIARCLALRPDLRFADARALQRALADAASPAPPRTEDETAPPSSRAVVAPAPARRTWIVVAAAATAAVGAGAWLATRDDPAPPPAAASAPAVAERACDWPRELLRERVQALSPAQQTLSEHATGASWGFMLQDGWYHAEVADYGKLSQAGGEFAVSVYLATSAGGSTWRSDPDKGVVYAARGSCAGMLVGPKSALTAERFEALFAGARWELRGSSIAGPDPARAPDELRGTARRLAELRARELETRVRALGDVANVDPFGSSVTVMLERGEGRGMIDLVVDANVEALEQSRRDKPFSFAYDGAVLVIASGAEPFREPAYLARALDGLGAEVRQALP